MLRLRQEEAAVEGGEEDGVGEETGVCGSVGVEFLSQFQVVDQDCGHCGAVHLRLLLPVYSQLYFPPGLAGTPYQD